jgi:putative transposase
MQALAQHIKKKKDDIWNSSRNGIKVSHTTNSWFNISETIASSEISINKIPNHIQKEEVIKCKKVEVIMNDEQTKIIMNWFAAYAQMYNETIEFLKKDNSILRWETLRTKCLKDIRNEVQKNSQTLGLKRKTRVQTHTLDAAIKTACANWKTSVKNRNAGRIKYFRIRKWRMNKRQLIMDIEPQCFKSGTLCPKTFGRKMAFVYDGKEFDTKTIKSECKMLYDQYYNKKFLFVPITHHVEVKEPIKKGTVSLDPGIRTFLTGVSENSAMQIGENASKKLYHLHKQIDTANEKITSKKQKKKVLQRCRRKIVGLVDDLHWKAAKFLTDNYENILIGDFSAKGVSRKGGNLATSTKKVALSFSFYKFRERLQFKCRQTGRRMAVIDEHYTSKLCSMCGNYKKDLGSNEVYECDVCDVVMNRDINGARNIFFRSTY